MRAPVQSSDEPDALDESESPDEYADDSPSLGTDPQTNFQATDSFTPPSETKTRRKAVSGEALSLFDVEGESPTKVASPAAKSPRSQGCRIPDSWKPSAETVEWCAKQRVDGPAHVAEFVDYWLAKPGKDGIKLDWEATFRNFIRKRIEWGNAKQLRTSAPPMPPRKPKVEDVHTVPTEEELRQHNEALEFIRATIRKASTLE